jgi:hypothetical protein
MIQEGQQDGCFVFPLMEDTSRQLGVGNVPLLRVCVDGPGKRHVFWDKSHCFPTWVP